MTVFWVGTALITAGRDKSQNKCKEVVFDLDESHPDIHSDELQYPASYDLAPESAVVDPPWKI